MLEIAIFLLGLVFSVIGYFLRQKDAEQARQIAALREDLGASIKLLFSKHDIDATALQDLRLQIAREHYQKEELDARFDKLEQAFKAGFEVLGDRFDKLSETLVQYVRDSARDRRQ